MNIFSIGNFGKGWDGSICDEEHIAGALEKLGHIVKRAQRESELDMINHDLDGYDFILIAQWDGYKEDLIPMLRKNYGLKWTNTSKVPKIVYWAFDYQADGQEWHERLVREADLYLSKRIADSKYPNWQWLAQDFAPEFLRRVVYGTPREKDIDVLFTGSWLSWAKERIELMQAVQLDALEKGYKFVIHTVNPNDWPGSFMNVKGPIMDEGLPELYARAKVILSIDHTIEAGYWSDRNAQIMACGRRPLFRYVPFSENTFHNDVDYFYSTEDCLDQIEFILAGLRPSVLEEISYRASERLRVIQKVGDLLTIVKSVL